MLAKLASRAGVGLVFRSGVTWCRPAHPKLYTHTKWAHQFRRYNFKTCFNSLSVTAADYSLFLTAEQFLLYIIQKLPPWYKTIAINQKAGFTETQPTLQHLHYKVHSEQTTSAKMTNLTYMFIIHVLPVMTRCTKLTVAVCFNIFTKPFQHL